MAETATMYPVQQKAILDALLELMCQADCVGGKVAKIIMDKPMFEATRKLLDYDTFCLPGTEEKGQPDNIVHVVNTDREFKLVGIQITQEGE